MAVATGLLRYCMRHPTRMLFILLLLLLVIVSRFLYSSVPEQQHVHELNLMVGGLSQQHRHKSDRKHPVNKNTLERGKAPDIETSLKSDDREKGLSQEETGAMENSRANEVVKLIMLKGEEEKTENDLNRRKIPDRDMFSHENEGHLSPFEGEVKDGELTEKKTREKIRNHFKQPDSLPEKNDSRKRKRSKQKKHKHSVPQQGYNIMMVLAKVGQTSSLAKRFKQCVLLICEHSSVNLSFHVLVDEVGKLTCEDTFSQAGKVCKKGLNVTYYNVREVAEKVQPVIQDIQHMFRAGDPNSYYSDPLFFVSTAIHHVLPQKMMRIIWLDSDLSFRADIKQLFGEFDRFKPTTVFGLAREQQPVYRHVLHMYRDQNPGTKVGGPPPDGLTGFNSGVILINLQSMRASKIYNKLLKGDIVKRMANKYTFQGHLGDQDFYSLLNLDHPELFHILPCSWNRQLCTYWRDHGYAEVFDSYFNCSEHIQVYHGNCGTHIPDE